MLISNSVIAPYSPRFASAAAETIQSIADFNPLHLHSDTNSAIVSGERCAQAKRRPTLDGAGVRQQQQYTHVRPLAS